MVPVRSGWEEETGGHRQAWEFPGIFISRIFLWTGTSALRFLGLASTNHDEWMRPCAGDASV